MSKITELRDLSSSSLYIDYTSVMLFLKNSGVAQLGLEPTYASDVKPLSSWWVIKRPPFLAEDRKSVYTAPPPGSFPVPPGNCGIVELPPLGLPHTPLLPTFRICQSLLGDLPLCPPPHGPSNLLPECGIPLHTSSLTSNGPAASLSFRFLIWIIMAATSGCLRDQIRDSSR